MIDQVHSLRKNSALNYLLKFFDVAQYLRQKRNSQRTDAYLHKALEERYREYRAAAAAASAGSVCSGAPTSNGPGDPQGKAVIDLLLQAYMTQQLPTSASASSTAATTTSQLPTFEGPRRHEDALGLAFRAAATQHLRFLMLGGSDSTSAAICYLLHLLATHPAALSRVRANHDPVFGHDVSCVAAILVEEPRRLIVLPYSDTAIKETLRLFALATSIRRGAPGHDGALRGNADVRDADSGHGQHKAAAIASENDHRVNINIDNGYCGTGDNKSLMRGLHEGSTTKSSSTRYYPTDGAVVWTLQPAMQRLPRYWDPRSDEFVPEHWLATSDSPSSQPYSASSLKPEAVAGPAGDNTDATRNA
jgi:hypothetical protein